MNHQLFDLFMGAAQRHRPARPHDPVHRSAPPAQLAFTAEPVDRAAVLRWSTARLLPGTRYEVEAAADEQPFAVVAVVADDPADACVHYQLTDARLPEYGAARVAYRVRCIGPAATALSVVRVVPAPGGVVACLRVYPAVAAGRPVRYAYHGPALPAGAMLEIHDAAGRCVGRQPAAVAGTLHTQRLGPGWYEATLGAGHGQVQAGFGLL